MQRIYRVCLNFYETLKQQNNIELINNREMPHVVSVKELLRNKELTIPEYQRPYKWTERNVNQLIDDILSNTEKSAYRIGTLVIHRDVVNGKTIDNIVDGQQRTITIVLIAYALINSGTIKYVINRENSRFIVNLLLFF